MKIQILFGSQSDEPIYSKLTKNLSQRHEVKMDVASAHRDPEMVNKIVKSDWAHLYIAGAGLSAHLPGVVASLTKKPVFGLAAKSAFEGLDSFLSIVQMPKGVPVATVTENQMEAFCQYILNVANSPLCLSPTIKIYIDPKIKEERWFSKIQTELIESTIKDLEFNIQMTHEFDSDCAAEIVGFQSERACSQLALLACSLDDLNQEEKALHFYHKAKQGGQWVGVNNVTNFLLQIKKMRAHLCN